MTGEPVKAAQRWAMKRWPDQAEAARCHHPREQLYESRLTRECWRSCSDCDTDKMATYIDLLTGRTVPLQ